MPICPGLIGIRLYNSQPVPTQCSRMAIFRPRRRPEIGDAALQHRRVPDVTARAVAGLRAFPGPVTHLMPVCGGELTRGRGISLAVHCHVLCRPIYPPTTLHTWLVSSATLTSKSGSVQIENGDLVASENGQRVVVLVLQSLDSTQPELGNGKMVLRGLSAGNSSVYGR
jgi:hypothetical protein